MEPLHVQGLKSGENLLVRSSYREKRKLFSRLVIFKFVKNEKIAKCKNWKVGVDLVTKLHPYKQLNNCWLFLQGKTTNIFGKSEMNYKQHNFNHESQQMNC